MYPGKFWHSSCGNNTRPAALRQGNRFEGVTAPQSQRVVSPRTQPGDSAKSEEEISMAHNHGDHSRAWRSFVLNQGEIGGSSRIAAVLRYSD